ncbi:60S ribosomal protein L36 [Entamoeba marina]
MARGIAVGLKKGFPTRKMKQPKKRFTVSKRKALVNDVAREVSGFASYERHMLDLLRRGLDKKALKYAKKQLGTHKRGLAKREQMTRVIDQMKKHA